MQLLIEACFHSSAIGNALPFSIYCYQNLKHYPAFFTLGNLAHGVLSIWGTEGYLLTVTRGMTADKGKCPVAIIYLKKKKKSLSVLLLKELVLFPLNRISLKRYFLVRCALAREMKLYSPFWPCICCSKGAR